MFLGENEETERLRMNIMLVELPPPRRNWGKISLHAKNWLIVAFIFKQMFHCVYVLDYKFYNCSTALLNVDCYYGGVRALLQKNQNRFSFSLVNALISLSRSGIPKIFLLYFWIFTALQSYELMLIVLGLFFFPGEWSAIWYVDSEMYFFLAVFFLLTMILFCYSVLV